MARIIAVCRSNKKGISKNPIDEGVFRENYGLVDDAHADSGTHRQVSLLALSSIEKMRSLGIELASGGLAENLTVDGLDLLSLPIGTRLELEQGVILEVTQIGKECHTGCAIRRQVGYCIFPTEGIFTRVIKGGLIKAEDEIRIIENEN
ncbi:MOSC domain-containing protein [Chloroflexota bacterium]